MRFALAKDKVRKYRAKVLLLNDIGCCGGNRRDGLLESKWQILMIDHS
jgi:hypothetical protein